MLKISYSQQEISYVPFLICGDNGGVTLHKICENTGFH